MSTKRMCSAISRYPTDDVDSAGPRPCRMPARPGSDLCGSHLFHARKPVDPSKVEARQGGSCIWCAAPANHYVTHGADPIEVPICNAHAKALARAIKEAC